MKSGLVTILLLCLVVGLAYIIVCTDHSWGVFNWSSENSQMCKEVWDERDKVTQPSRYIAYLRKRIEIRRSELLSLLEQYDDQGSAYELQLNKLKEESARIDSFFARAKEVYHKGCGTVDIDGVTYSEIDFLRISVEKDNRRKEVAKAIAVCSERLIRNGRVGKNLAEQALDKLQREDRRLHLMSEELAMSERNDKIIELIKELDDIDLDVESLPIEKIRSEIKFGESEAERVKREGEALYNAKAD